MWIRSYRASVPTLKASNLKRSHTALARTRWQSGPVNEERPCLNHTHVSPHTNKYVFTRFPHSHTCARNKWQFHHAVQTVYRTHVALTTRIPGCDQKPLIAPPNAPKMQTQRILETKEITRWSYVSFAAVAGPNLRLLCSLDSVLPL